MTKRNRILFVTGVVTLVLCALLSGAVSASMRPVIRGTDYAVSTRKPEATLVGLDILDKGGNAFDAAVATQVVLGLTDPAMNGTGSDACILLYDAKTKQVISVNAEGISPALATVDWYMENANGEIPANDSLLAATVPGIVDAWCTILDKWGTMSLTEVLAPGIEMAENGFPISEMLAGQMNSDKIKKYPTSAALYFPDGKTEWKAGDILTNKQIANTFRKLVEAEQKALAEGKSRSEALQAARDRFYKGDIAEVMAKFSEENGGLFRYEDFAAYSVQVSEAVKVNYRGYDVWANPSSTQGPTMLFWLSMLNGYDLTALGLNTPDYLHLMIETAKLAYADREQYLGDWDFIKIPFKGLLSEAYAAERRKLVDPNVANGDLRPGDAWAFEGQAAIENYLQVAKADPFADDSIHEGDTSYLCVVDKDRNMVSWTPSLHSGWGCGVVMADLGLIFNCRGDYYHFEPGHANELKPHKRPRSTLAPLLVTKADEPFMVLGSPGGDDQPQRLVQLLVNVVDFGMNIQDAIEAPRFRSSSFPASTFPHIMYPNRVNFEDRIPAETVDILTAKGHNATFVSAWNLGAQCAIMVDETNILNAGADPRGDNYALAR